MAGQSAEPIQQSAVFDELQHDLVGNGMGAVLQRERNAKRERQQRSALAGEHAAARYRKLVMDRPDIADVEFRVLCMIVEYADGNLSNSFVSPETIRQHIGGRRRKIRAVYGAIARLQAKGYLRRHRGRGWQLRLPEGVLAPGADGWDGPTDWSNRWKEKA